MAEEDLDEELGITDCLIITRAFERGAMFATTPEATYALMTPQLSIARIQSSALTEQIETDNSVLSMLGADNILSSEKETNTLSEQLRQDWIPDKGQVQGTGRPVDSTLGFNLFNSKCIPCGDRINLAGEFGVKMVWADAKKYIQMWYQFLKEQLSQLMKMLSMLTSWESQAVDLCVLLKFFTEFVCVPDLARILSLLMAFMMKISFDLNIVFDLILQFAAPLIQPFLSNFTNLLMKYAHLIIAPIECIVNAIQGMLAKLDYNVLFQNIEQLNRSFSFGRNIGEQTGSAGEQTTTALTLGGAIPWINIDVNLHKGPRTQEESFNLLGPVGDVIKEENQENKKAVEQAANELRTIQSVRINNRDISAVKQHQEKLENARKKYEEAIDKRDLSSIGRASKQLGQTLDSFKSTIYMLISMLKEAVQAFETFLKSVFDELAKIMNEFFGGGGNFLQLLSSKLAIAQMVGFITSLIKTISEMSLNCDDEKDIKVERVLPKTANKKVWTDEEGNLHIEEDDSIAGYVETIVSALGVTPQQNSLGFPSPLIDSGNETPMSANSVAPRQRLKSLIKFTGDPELDSTVLRAVNTLTTPVNVTFKCPLKASVEDVEQINRWIQELA